MALPARQPNLTVEGFLARECGLQTSMPAHCRFERDLRVPPGDASCSQLGSALPARDTWLRSQAPKLKSHSTSPRCSSEALAVGGILAAPNGSCPVLLRDVVDRWRPLSAQRPARAEEEPPSVGREQSAAPAFDQEQGVFTEYVDYCVAAMRERMELWDFPLKDEFRRLRGDDGKGGPAVCRSTALQSHKIRQMRAADISAGSQLQVLNLVIFPRPEFDIPYFCADLVVFPRGQLFVIDLNPMHATDEYVDKYIREVIPLCKKHSEELPWGGEFTSESLPFFSPALLWSRRPPAEAVAPAVFGAFKDYLQAWLDMVERVEPEMDPEKVAANREAQHRYLCWRAGKDPGRPVLTRLFGEARCERLIHEFLFDGLTTLGSKTFVDYFPQYRQNDGSVCKKRSILGRSYATRPWDDNGRLIA